MRIIHLLVIAALVFAAAYVYRIKMDSTSRTCLLYTSKKPN